MSVRAAAAAKEIALAVKLIWPVDVIWCIYRRQKISICTGIVNKNDDDEHLIYCCDDINLFNLVHARWRDWVGVVRYSHVYINLPIIEHIRSSDHQIPALNTRPSISM